MNTFALASPSWRSLLFMFLIAVALPTAIAWFATRSASAAKMPLLLTFGITIVVYLAFVVWTWKSRLTLTASSLVIEGPAGYGYELPLKLVDRVGVKVLPTLSGTDLRPKIRNNGIGLYEYYVGHFTLKNGNKAYLHVGGSLPIVAVPTVDGNYVLLSTIEHEALYEKLRAQ